MMSWEKEAERGGAAALSFLIPLFRAHRFRNEIWRSTSGKIVFGLLSLRWHRSTEFKFVCSAFNFNSVDTHCHSQFWLLSGHQSNRQFSCRRIISANYKWRMNPAVHRHFSPSVTSKSFPCSLIIVCISPAATSFKTKRLLGAPST